MSTGLESQFSGLDTPGVLPTASPTETTSLEAQLQRANELLRAQLAAARQEIERERQEREELRRAAEAASLGQQPPVAAEQVVDGGSAVPLRGGECSTEAFSGGYRQASFGQATEMAWQEEEIVSSTQNLRTGRVGGEARSGQETAVAPVSIEPAAEQIDSRDEIDAQCESSVSCELKTCETEVAEMAMEDTGSSDLASIEPETSEIGFSAESGLDHEASLAEDETAKGSDDDDSIEAHIAAFMKRMGAGSSGLAASSQPSRPRKRPVESAPTPMIERRNTPRETAPAGTPDPTAAVIDGGRAPMTLERRVCADVTDLAALRAVANTHTRLALHTHSKRQLVRTLCTRLVGAAACLIAGVIGLSLTERALSGFAMIVIVAGIYFMFLASEDAKRVVQYVKSRPASSDNSSDSGIERLPTTLKSCVAAVQKKLASYRALRSRKQKKRA